MATLVDYKGLQVVSPEPTGDGGLAIQNDFKHLVDWNPKNAWNASTDPGVDDDETEDYYPGSMWLRTDTTPPKLFTCQSSATGAAVWREIALTANSVASVNSQTGAVVLDYTDVGADAAGSAAVVAGNLADLINEVSESPGADLILRAEADGTINAGWLPDLSDSYQPLDAELTAISGLSSAADTLPYFTGSGTADLTPLTAYARSLLDDTSSTAAKNTLGLGASDGVQHAQLSLGASVNPAVCVGISGTYSATLPQILFAGPTFTGATSGARGVNFNPKFNGAYTCPLYVEHESNNNSVTGGATLTEKHCFRAIDTTGAVTMRGYVSTINSGTNRWAVYYSGTAPELHNGGMVLGSSAAPTLIADQAAIYAADVAAGNRAVHVSTENGSVLKLFQGTAIADATDATDVVTKFNSLLAHLRAMGVIAT
jgi:hypothetical protein